MKVILILIGCSHHSEFGKFCAECGIQLQNSGKWKPGCGQIYIHPTELARFFGKNIVVTCKYAGLSCAVADVSVEATLVGDKDTTVITTPDMGLIGLI